MTDFQTRIRAYGGEEIAQLTNIEYKPHRWSGTAATGYRNAVIDVSGNTQSIWGIYNLLGHEIEILTPHGQTVWEGRIWSTLVNVGSVSLGYSFDEMFNRVRVIYSERQDDNSLRRRQTDWAEDEGSTSKYGEFELQTSIGQASETEAELRRDFLLADNATLTEVIKTAAGGQLSGTLECRGWIDELGKKYYTQRSGYQAYDEPHNTTHPIGLYMEEIPIIFQEPNILRSHDERLLSLQTGLRIHVDAIPNAGDYIVEHGTNSAPAQYEGGGIHFVGNNQIRDTENGLFFLENETHVVVEDSIYNDGIREVDTYVDSGHITVTPATITNESGGTYTLHGTSRILVSPYTIEDGTSLAVDIDTDGYYVAMSFLFDSVESWDLHEVSIIVGKGENANTGLVVSLFDNNSGQPGSLITSSSSIAASNIPSTPSWVTFRFPSPHTLNHANIYWLVVSPSATLPEGRQFNVGLVQGSDNRYALGSLKVSDFHTWYDRITDADMPFRLWGRWDTTKQIEEIVNECGQWIQGVEIPSESGITTRQYRVGDRTGLDELKDLMAYGFDDGSRMLARVTSGRKLHIYADPADPNDPRFALRMDGTVTYANGDPIPPGLLPIANYATLPESPIPFGTGLNPFYIESAEYNARTGRYTLRPKGSSSPWNITSVSPG